MRLWLIRLLESILLDLGWTPPVVQAEVVAPAEKRVGKIVRKVTRLIKGFPDLDRAMILKEIEQAIVNERVSDGT